MRKSHIAQVCTEQPVCMVSLPAAPVLWSPSTETSPHLDTRGEPSLPVLRSDTCQRWCWENHTVTQVTLEVEVSPAKFMST